MDNAAKRLRPIKNGRFSSIDLYSKGFFFITLISLIGAAIAAYYRFKLNGLGIDDADIFFVYARNFVDGYGFVYNPGGEHVEGFTSILWTFIVCLGFSLFKDPKLFLVTTNILFLSLSITLVMMILRERLCNANTTTKIVVGILLLIWCLSSPEFITWQIHALMETALWTFSLTLCFFSCFQLANNFSKIYCNLLSLGLIILNLTRPEALAFSALFLSFYLIILGSHQRTFSPPSNLVKISPIIATITILLLIFVLRYFYFGEWLPNTYYAKVDSNKIYNLMHGIHYILDFFIEKPAICMAILAAMLLLLSGITSVIETHIVSATNFQDAFIGCVCLASFSIPLLVGGDHFSGFRFLQPFWLFYFIPLAILIFKISNHIPRSINRLMHGLQATTVVMMIIFLMTINHRANWLQPSNLGLVHDFQLSEAQRKLGWELNRLFPAPNKPSVGVSAAGGFKYMYDGVVIDLMGLNDRTIAHLPGKRQGIKDHAAFNTSYFYKVQPAFLEPNICDHIDGNAAFVPTDFEMSIYKKLFADDKFKQQYSYVKLKPKPDSTAVCAFVRNDVILAITTLHPFAFEVISNHSSI